MKYFTKEWYNDSLVADMCFQLRQTEKAFEYSDKFYEKLYAVEEKAYIRYRKRELKALKQSMTVEEIKKEFCKNTESNLEFVKSNLPDEILSEIADVRILALGSVTSDMHVKITKYCGRLNSKCQSAERRYEEESDEAFERIDGKTSKILSDLAGAELISIDQDTGKITLELSNDYSDISFTLTNANATEENAFVKGSFVVKPELIYNEEKKFEFSLLCITDSLETHTYSFIADEISANKR